MNQVAIAITENHQLVLEATLRYLKSPMDTSYGYLIRGEWGSGKTHFWKNSIKPEIKGLSYAYVSLFGTASIDKLKSQILISYLAETQVSEARTWFGRKFIRFLCKLWEPARKSMTDIVSGLVEKHLGIDAKEFLGRIDLSVDPLRLLPEGVIILLDDVERAGVQLKDLMGVANYLIEHKKARLVFLADEEKISDENYKEFKEKIIRRTLLFSSSFPDAYDAFSLKIKSATISLKFVGLKNLFLKIFIDLNCNNLRTLQKAMDIVSEFISFDTSVEIPEQDIAFLIYLAIADSATPLTSSFEDHKTKRKLLENDRDTETNPPTKHQQLYLKMEESRQQFEHKDILYIFVKDGIIDRTIFNDAYIPKAENESPTVKAIRWANENAWWALSDDALREKIEEIKNVLYTEKNETVTRIVRLFIKGMQLSSILGEEETFSAQVLQPTKNTVINNTREYETIRIFDTISPLCQQKAQELINEFKNQIKRKKIALEKEHILNDLKQTRRSDLNFESDESFVALSELLQDGKYLLVLNEQRSSPEYFASACNIIHRSMKKYGHLEEHATSQEIFGTFLSDIKSSTKSKVEKEMIARVIEFEPAR